MYKSDPEYDQMGSNSSRTPETSSVWDTYDWTNRMVIVFGGWCWRSNNLFIVRECGLWGKKWALFKNRIWDLAYKGYSAQHFVWFYGYSAENYCGCPEKSSRGRHTGTLEQWSLYRIWTFGTIYIVRLSVRPSRRVRPVVDVVLCSSFLAVTSQGRPLGEGRQDPKATLVWGTKPFDSTRLKGTIRRCLGGGRSQNVLERERGDKTFYVLFVLQVPSLVEYW